MCFFTFSHFLLCWKVYFSPWATGSVKSTSADYSESNKRNPKSLSHYRVWEISRRTWSFKKWAFLLSFTFFAVLKNLLFPPEAVVSQNASHLLKTLHHLQYLSRVLGLSHTCSKISKPCLATSRINDTSHIRRLTNCDISTRFARIVNEMAEFLHSSCRTYAWFAPLAYPYTTEIGQNSVVLIRRIRKFGFLYGDRSATLSC